jgi:hypothetical protein
MSGALGGSAQVLQPRGGISVGLPIPIKRFHAIGLLSSLLVFLKLSAPLKGHQQ